ncbi:MAG: hypothetical protein HPZ86_00685 [Clostridia bacterium]|nr:hypothetical protein [Clostridia bacterium]
MRNRRLEAKIAELAREKTGKELTENLKESGWDERGLVALMAWIEERFGFFFDAEDLQADKLLTLRDLSELTEKYVI